MKTAPLYAWKQTPLLGDTSICRALPVKRKPPQKKTTAATNGGLNPSMRKLGACLVKLK